MSRIAPVLLFSTALCLMASIQTKSEAQTASAIPAYFFDTWTVNRDCTEQHAGRGSHSQPGLKFRVTRSTSEAGEGYALEVVSTVNGPGPASWPKVKLEYRAGAQLTSIPADMECVPGEEASSPFLAMSGFSQSSEPYYGYAHWYGQITLHGEKHHFLLFPRNVHGPSSAAIMLVDADASDNLQLDHDGTIIVEN